MASSPSLDSIPASAASENESEQPISDEETAESEISDAVDQDAPSSQIVLSGPGKKSPLLIFRADVVYKRVPEVKAVGERYHMAYKLVKTECKLLRTILNGHGFHEAHPNSNDFNIMWTGSHVKPYVLRALTEFQKVNHFPRSYEITRKDRLYKNIQRMQQTKGMKHFDFIPQSFITPSEFQDFCSAFLKDKGPWIVKPVASSRGRGIFLASHPDQVPLDETFIVAKYVNNPLTIDGFKFDIRLYVAVTSYDPLCIYLYEEGLTRFATIKYEKGSNRNIKNQMMHLTNYSVNKKSNDFVQNDDPNVEDYGNKWSLGAMLRYLRSEGQDTTALMMRIEDVLIKTIISAELPIATACKMFMPHKGNCFEVYGFDILIDSNLRPWILEVNLSPSLACDAPLDLKIKSHMLSDLFSLTGFTCHDPMMRTINNPKKIPDPRASSRQSFRQRPFSAPSSTTRGSRPTSASSVPRKLGKTDVTGLSVEEVRMMRRVKEENKRRGGWVRIFPTRDSYELYGSFLQFTSNNNLLLHQRLFPDKHRPGTPVITPSSRPVSKYHYSGKVNAGLSSINSKLKSWTIHIHSAPYAALTSGTGPECNEPLDFGEKLRLQALKAKQSQMEHYMRNAVGRSEQYERKLRIHGSVNPRARRTSQKKPANVGPQPKATFRGSLVQGVVASAKEQKQRRDAEEKPPLPITKPLTNGSVKHTVERTEEPEAIAVEQKKTILEKTQEPKRPPSPRLDVVGCLHRGGKLSKVQARTAFAMYLSRVQMRLMTETNTADFSDVESANEQMDLVLRFLKRAATNLQQSFKIVVPSRKLPLNDRRRILAKQLGDFVHIYGKETEQLSVRKQVDRKHIRTKADDEPSLDERRFTKFVTVASESELEEVLTTYTKLNKSASIFLGSSAKTSDLSTGAPEVRAPSDTSLHRPKEETMIKIPTRTEYEQSKASDPAWNNIDEAGDGQLRKVVSNTRSPMQQTAGVYSQKLAVASRQRPASAGMHGRSVSARSGVSSRPHSASVSRPTSSTIYRDVPDGKSDVEETEDLNNALQRISIRQQKRNYSASSKSSVLVQGYPTTLGSTNAGRHRAHPRSHSVDRVMDNRVESGMSTASGNEGVILRARTVDSEIKESKSRTRSIRDPRLADATFDEFIEANKPSWQNDLVAAYNKVTGVAPMNAYVPSRGSKQYQVMQQKQQEKQKLSEQSREQLELSKAKHQAMIAQAHAAQRHHDHDKQDVQQYHAPKPPAGGPKKPIGSHRLARTSTIDDNVYGNGFYGSLQYDSSTGRAKPSVDYSNHS